jgi:hypothetical protein
MIKDRVGFATSYGVGIVVALVQGLNFELNLLRTSQDRNIKINSGFSMSI